jgi:FecR protein
MACGALAAHADEPPQPATPPAAATDVSQVGRSIFVANDVAGQAGDTPAKHIAVNDDIVFEEDITTGSDAKAVLEFRDGSTFEIGPDAAVRIDSFVFNPEESTSHKALNVTRGVFRYVSAYVASDQDTKITTSNGQIGIRGSVAEGIVDPAVPDFVYLGEGNATFTNSAGSSALQAGSSIAVPSAATPPMAPETMPAPVAAQALQAIETRLPPRAALANRPAADDAWLKRAGAADLVPASEQQRAMTAASAKPLPTANSSGSLAGELGLLAEANRLSLFNGRQSARTPEQAAFLARATHDNPNAATTLRRFTADAHAMHAASVTAGTAFVIRGVGHAAPSAEVMRRVTAASMHANPGAAALIAHHAGESYRGADRGELSRPGKSAAERPAAERPSERQPAMRQPAARQPPSRQPPGRQPSGRQPNNFERRQPNGNAHAPPQRAAPQRPAPRPPAQPPAQKQPPKKKGDEQNQR